MATYSAGTATVDILPSLKGFQSRIGRELRGINPAVKVGVVADIAKAQRQISSLSARQSIKILAEMDKKSLDKAEAAVKSAEDRMASARNQHADAVARLDVAEKQLAETRQKGNAKASQIAAAELRVAQAKRAAASATHDLGQAESILTDARKNLKDVNVRIGTDVDTTTASGKLKAFAIRAGRAYQVKLGVDPDLGSAEARLAAFKATAARLSTIHANVDLDTGAAIAKATALSAAGAGIGTGIAGGVGIAGAALATLPAAIVAVLGAVGALTAGIAGVPAAFKAFSDAEDQAAQNATSNAKAQAAAARQIVSARQQVTQAQTQLSRAYEDASVAQEAALRRVSEAERQVITAERTRLQAQQDLTRAVEDARRAQQDLAFQVAGGALAERQAVLDLADAQQALDNARATGVSGADLERVQLAYEQQALSLDEIRARNKNLTQDKAASDAQGIQGSDQVVAAQQRVQDATQGVADAQQGVSDAQAEAARSQVQSQRSIADAQLQVAQAQQQLVQAFADAGTVGAASTDKINAAMAKLSPQAKAFVTDVRGLAPEFDNLKKVSQDALFNGLGPAFVQFGQVALPAMAKNFAVVSGAINGVTKDMLGFLGTQQSVAQFQQLFAGIGQVITASGPVVQTFVGLFLNLATAAMPGIVALVQAVGTIGTALANALQPLIQSGAVTQAVSLIAQVISSLAPIIAQVVAVAIQLWNAIGPTLVSVIQALTPVINTLLGLFQQIAPILAGVVLQLAQALMPVVQALAPIIAQLMPPIAELITAGLQILIPLVQAASQIFLALMPAIQTVAHVIADLVPVIAPLIAQLATALIPLAKALVPVIVQLAAIFAQGLATALNTLIPFIIQVVQALTPMIPVVMSIINQLVSGLLPIFAPLASAFLQLLSAVLPILPPLLQIVDALLPAIISLIGTLMPIITILAQLFTSVLASVIENVVVPALNTMAGAIKIVADIVKWLYDNIIKPVWDAIGSVIDFAWNHVIKPIFDSIGEATKAVGDFFRSMGDTISGIWGAIKRVVHDGIQAVVDLVYNNGIRALANAVIKFIPGVSELPELKIPDFAVGGVLPGYAPGKDTVPAMLSPGEAVLVPELVKAIGAPTILAANAVAMRNRFAAGGIVQRFADGGVATSTTQAQPVTVDPSAIAAAGDVAAAAAAQVALLTASLTQLAGAVVSVVDPAVTLVSTTITTVAVPALLMYGQQTTALGLLAAAQWLGITTSVNTSVSAQETALTALQTALSATRAAMQATADWAVTQFDRIRAAAADPIRWVIQFPVNAGLIGAWNAIDSAFSFGRHVDPIGIGFASGGYVTGPGTATSDSIRAWLSNGEFVVPADVTAKTLPFLEALRSGQPEALQAAGYRTSYATGGLVADTGSALDARVASGMVWLQQQSGKPYIWGGVGPEGYDCSGLVSAMTNVLRGESNPYRRLGVAASQPWPGFVPGLSTAFATGFNSSHTAATLAGVNLEAQTSGVPIMVGGRAAGADSPQFSGHASLPLVGGKFVSGGGGIDFASLIGPYFSDTYRMLGQIATMFAGNLMADQAGGMATQATDGAKAAAISALTALSATTAAAGSPEVVGAVRSIAAQFGWGDGPQWDALSQLIAHESGWNPAAANPSSSARGLFQKLTSVNGPLEPTVAGQAQWGLNYILSRYGSPVNAWSAWQSRSPHWYDQGGIADGVGWMYKGTLEPERVLSPAQTRAFDALVANISTTSAAADTQAGPSQFTGSLYLDSGEFLGMVDGRIQEANDNTAADIYRGRRS